MVRKIGQIIRHGPSTWLVRIYLGRDPETPEAQVRGQIRSWWAVVYTGPPLPQTRGAGSRSQHPFISANRLHLPRSLAPQLCPSTVAGGEFSRLLEPARKVHPSATGQCRSVKCRPGENQAIYGEYEL